MDFKPLHRFSVIVAAATLCLLFAGGLVTSTGSGLSVPDWPLSYGRFFPPMIGGIRFEHSHRVIAGTVAILTFVLTGWIFKKEKRSWMKRLGFAASFAILLQAILGGLTVKFLLPLPVSVAHACLGQTFFCIAAAIALFTSKEWLGSPRDLSVDSRSIHRLLVTTLFFVYLQLIVGAVVRHSAGHQGIQYHFVLAFLIFFHIVLVAVKITAQREARDKLFKHTIFLGSLVLLQVLLGFGSFIFKFLVARTEMPTSAEVLLTTAHQTTGALILASTLLLWLRFRRIFMPLKAATERKRSSWKDYIELTKMRLTLLAVATALLGFFIASDGSSKPALLFHTLFACLLIGSAANALNQFLEREIDAKMKRTENRPLPAGKMDPQSAFVFGITLATFGILELFFWVNTSAGLLGLATLFCYLFFYTPMKRKTYLNTFIGAISGALPCVIGWAAAGGRCVSQATALFFILFVWQLPHFFAIAWVYREDYERGGLRMLSLYDASGSRSAQHILFYSALLLPVSLVPALVGISGRAYLFSALTAGLFLISFAFFMLFGRLYLAKKFVSASIYYLVILILAMTVDKRI